jgi:4-phosphopantoate--beta-alanine ligase
LNIPEGHPRAKSLRTREELIDQCIRGVVTPAGLVAHGRGEAFDYLLGEKTTRPALKATGAAAAALLLAERPVISVNGNVAALAAEYIIQLAHVVNAKIEVNLFYRSSDREIAIKDLLEKGGANGVLGVGEDASARIPELGSERRRVDPRGIYVADVVLVPLEDGDRTEALVKMGKRVIAIDLNPLSRTAQRASITIVDNIVRAAPKLVQIAEELREDKEKCLRNLADFDNRTNLAGSIMLIEKRLSMLAREKKELALGEESLDL